jgi:putative hemolysin
MKISLLVGLGAVMAMTIACSPSGDNAATTEQASTPRAGCTPLPAPADGIGVANPASAYCSALGYTVADSRCAFSDGTSCDEWSFYEGLCGQARSFCARNGGRVANEVADMGGWTASVAICHLPDGASCREEAFAQSCVCGVGGGDSCTPPSLPGPDFCPNGTIEPKRDAVGCIKGYECGPKPADTCTALGGTCVGLSPSSCPSNRWADASEASCGDGVGSGCCLPTPANACEGAGGECTALTPDSCSDGVWTQDACGGIGVGCCVR